MNLATLPDEVGPNEDGTRLRISWRDGAESSYAPRALRLACPCAACVEEMTGRPILDPASVAADVHPRSIDYVGRYALRFVWSDGHSTGIYPFDYLRRMADEGRAG
jgi:ATP-binding protein involved in chromosome partitioning